MRMNPEVDSLLEKKKHPLDAEIRKVRAIILAADDRVGEAVKWSTPTFIYKGNIASFFMNAKKFVSLMFHKGAMLNDPSGLLEGDGKEARTARFQNMEDIENKKEALVGIIREWIRMQDEQG